MYSRADKIVGLVGEHAGTRAFHGLRGRWTENFLYVEGRPFQHDVGRREGAHVASSARERYPWRRYVLACGRRQRGNIVPGSRRDIRHQVGPVEERRGEVDIRRARPEYAEAVGDEYSGVVGIQTRLRRQNVIGRVRDQDRVVSGIERPVVLDEIEQVGHLLQVRRDVGIVAREVHVVELDVYDVLDFPRARVKLARARTVVFLRSKCRLAAQRGQRGGQNQAQD